MTVFRETAEQIMTENIRKLYNLAYFTVENQTVAERLTKKAFFRTYRNFSGLSLTGIPDLQALEQRCVRRLFVYICRLRKAADDPTAGAHSLTEILNGLNRKKRFIALLFILYRYPACRISDTVRMPFHFSKMHVYAALNEAALNLNRAGEKRRKAI